MRNKRWLSNRNLPCLNVYVRYIGKVSEKEEYILKWHECNYLKEGVQTDFASKCLRAKTVFCSSPLH